MVDFQSHTSTDQPINIARHCAYDRARIKGMKNLIKVYLMVDLWVNVRKPCHVVYVQLSQSCS